MDLVQWVNGEGYCDSSVVARKFGMKHNDVVRTIKRVLPNLDDFRGANCTPKIKEFEGHYRGTDYKAYRLNKDAFIIVMMRFETKRARQWQGKFIGAFNALANRVALADRNAADKAWLGQREQGKLARKEETDVIQRFVEYATAQGSKSARHYYKHITNATYKALGLMTQRKPKLRDTINLYEISELLLAERVARMKIQEYMDLGREYHDIYESVKNDLVQFGESILLSGVNNGKLS